MLPSLVEKSYFPLEVAPQITIILAYFSGLVDLESKEVDQDIVERF